MALTTTQQATLKAALLADSELAAFPPNADGSFALAALLNTAASPDYWVWRSKITQSEIVSTTSGDATTFSWTTYIGRSAGERDAWRQMFANSGDAVNPSNANVRAAFADIFSGVSGAGQRAHLVAVGRRKATRGEKIFASATPGGSGESGSTGNPASMGFEGALAWQDVDDARNS